MAPSSGQGEHDDKIIFGMIESSKWVGEWAAPAPPGPAHLIALLGD
jgi:hypothetical protein